MPRSELFKPEYATKWANYDPKLANKLLDEIGLTKKDSQGIRLLPDGSACDHRRRTCQRGDRRCRRCALIADNWKKIGIKMLTKPQTRENFRLRTFSGEAVMTAFAGAVTGGADGQHQPQGVRANHAGRPAMVALGHVRRVEGPAGREVRHGIGLQAARLREGMGDRCDVRGPAQGVGEDPARPTPTRSSRSAR